MKHRTLFSFLIIFSQSISLLNAQQHEQGPYWKNSIIFGKEVARGFTQTLGLGVTGIAAAGVGGAFISQVTGNTTIGKAYGQNILEKTLFSVGALMGAKSMGRAIDLNKKNNLDPIFYTKDYSGNITFKQKFLIAPAEETVFIGGEAGKQLQGIKAKIAKIAQKEGNYPNGSDEADQGFMGLFLNGSPGYGKSLATKVFARDLLLITRNPHTKNRFYHGKKPIILQVKMSEITSKWLGESEKLLEQIPAELEEISKAGYLPILEFPEADQFFNSNNSQRTNPEDVKRIAQLKVLFEEKLSHLCIVFSSANTDIDSAIKNRFFYKADVTPQNAKEWEEVIATTNDSILKKIFAHRPELKPLQLFLRQQALDFTKKGGGSPTGDTIFDIKKIPSGREFRDRYSQVIEKAVEIADEYEKFGIPVKKVLSSSRSTQSDSGKAEVEINKKISGSSSPQELLIRNIYDRAVAEATLEKQELPTPALQNHIEKNLYEKNPNTPYTRILKESRDLASLIDWATDKDASAGIELFDRSQKKIAESKTLSDDTSVAIPTIATIVALSGKASTDLEEDSNPLKTLMAAYQGMPGKESALDMSKSITVISYIETIDDETASQDPKKFSAKKESVKKFIIEEGDKIAAIAALTLSTITKQYPKIIPHNFTQNRSATAWIYSPSSTLNREAVQQFYRKAAQNPALETNFQDSSLD